MVAETNDNPVQAVIWRPLFGDPLEQVARVTARTSDGFGTEVCARVQWDGRGQFWIGGSWLPFWRLGTDMATAKVEAERRLGLLIQALEG